MKHKSYLGNNKLKAVGTAISFSEFQIQELIKCSNDPIYFITKYMKIVNLDRGLINFELYDYQQKFVNLHANNRFLVVLSSRQSGKTITYCGLILWNIIFNPNFSIAIFANKADVSRKILHRIKMAYENLPIWIQQGVVEWNKSSIELENGSTVIANSTASSSGRSGSYNLIVLDEYAFVPKNIAEDFMKSVYPTISSGQTTKVIIVSTANGMNHFYKIWTDAKNKLNQYVPLEISWWDVPGRDEKWKEITISNITEEAFKQEYENDFFGSNTDTLISMSDLKSLVYSPPIHQEEKNSLDIYKFAEENRSYEIFIDVSEGVGKDYSAALVIDVTNNVHEVVAKYRNNKIEPKAFSNVLYNLGRKYNDAFMLIETNNVGSQVADILYNDLEYENIFRTTKAKNFFNVQKLTYSVKSSKLGVKTTTSVKKVGCTSLKSLIEKKNLIINDFDTISELTTFVKSGQSYAASIGNNDDLSMCLVLYGWLKTQKMFRTIENNTGQILNEKINNLQEVQKEEFQLNTFIQKTDGSEYIFENSVKTGIDASWLITGKIEE